MVVLTPEEKPDLVRHATSDLAKEFPCQLLELKRRALEYFFVKRIDVVDEGRRIAHNLHGDRGPCPFGSAQFSPHLSARARAEAMREVIFEIPVVDIEGGHRHAGDAGEAGIHQALQRRTVFGRKFLQHDHRAIQFARNLRQKSSECVGCREVGCVITVEMSFACRAPDHQRSRAHEARPETPNANEHLFDAGAHAGEEVLINHKKWLDGPYGVIIPNDQVAVLESIRQRVFDQFVIAMIFSLIGER
jgi:hypothetical protein